MVKYVGMKFGQTWNCLQAWPWNGRTSLSAWSRGHKVNTMILSTRMKVCILQCFVSVLLVPVFQLHCSNWVCNAIMNSDSSEYDGEKILPAQPTSKMRLKRFPVWEDTFLYCGVQKFCVSTDKKSAKKDTSSDRKVSYRHKWHRNCAADLLRFVTKQSRLAKEEVPRIS